MDIAVTRFRAQCLELIRQVESGGEVIAAMYPRPWEMLLGSERLSPPERRCLDRLAAAGGCGLSAMSLWEAQMLLSKARLSPDRPFAPCLRLAAAPGNP